MMPAVAPSDLADALLSVIPSLPRTVLNRLVTDMIDRMDEMDGDADLEDDEREPDWDFLSPSSLRLPGVRGRTSRLRCREVARSRRYRAGGRRWLMRGRH